MCGSAIEYVCRLRFYYFTKSLMNIRTMKKDLQKQVLFSIYLCIFTDIFLYVFGLFK